MLKWYFVRDCSDLFEDELKALNMDGAAEEGKDLFDRLSSHDQNRTRCAWIEGRENNDIDNAVFGGWIKEP